MKKHDGTVYIGVVGPEIDYTECWLSIVSMQRRRGDAEPQFFSATKGYEARQKHYNQWRDSHHEFLLLLDHDMVFQPDTLERLRSHGLPYVSGYYLRRTYEPIYPVWYRVPPKHVFPLEYWLDPPERGRLHKIGASGWGCMLIHRDVADAMDDILKGEDAIIEDDMDIWPYDLDEVMRAVDGIKTLVEDQPNASVLRAALKDYSEVLSKEIRPLRYEKDDIVGSDLRYPFFAREVGYQLMGDPDVRPAHILYYRLNPDDYEAVPAEVREQMKKNTRRRVNAGRRNQSKNLNKFGRG